MKEDDVDAFIVQNGGHVAGGYVRWLTDVQPGMPSIPTTVIFSRDGEMTFIGSGDPSSPGPPDSIARGIGERIAFPYFRVFHTTQYEDAKIVIDWIKRLGKKNIGLVGLERMNASFYKYLVENLPDINFIDATDMVDEIKAVKSPAELEMVRETIWLHDKVMEAMPALIRQGRIEHEIRNDILHLAMELGAEGDIVLNVGSGPQGAPVAHTPLLYSNRRIEYGDVFCALLESSGPGGYFAELSRFWSLGEPCEDIKRAFEISISAQHVAAATLKPGGSPVETLRITDEYLVSRGSPPIGRLLGHAQGYDYMERPALIRSETMLYKENMVIAIHAAGKCNKCTASAVDNYLITKEGPVRMQTFPQEIIVL